MIVLGFSQILTQNHGEDMVIFEAPKLHFGSETKDYVKGNYF